MPRAGACYYAQAMAATKIVDGSSEPAGDAFVLKDVLWPHDQFAIHQLVNVSILWQALQFFFCPDFLDLFPRNHDANLKPDTESVEEGKASAWHLLCERLLQMNGLFAVIRSWANLQDFLREFVPSAVRIAPQPAEFFLDAETRCLAEIVYQRNQLFFMCRIALNELFSTQTGHGHRKEFGN